VRILLVNSMRTMGGGERWLLETAAGLTERGHEVSVAARAGSALACSATGEGHAVLELPMRGDADVLSVGRLARWMRARRIELLSVNVQRAVRIGCAAAALAGVRTVVERRGLTLPVRGTLINRTVYGRCLTHVVANCRAIADALVSAGTVEAKRVSVIPNGIDPARVPPGGRERLRVEFGLPEDAPLVAVVGRLVRDKGHGVAIEAFGRLLGALPGARMLVVGAGELEEELRAAARRAAPEGAILLAGHRDDVPAVLDAADVLLVTSTREGMPHVVLEAMAAGTPVVATRVAGLPEMIDDGRHGILIPPGSVDAARDALERVLTDRSLASSLAAEAAERVREEFTLDEMLDRFESLFDRLLSGRGGSVRPAVSGGGS
jgi:glycosyltransferase involved in cell wall biosynthesis